jgi:hypothetical protein
MIEERNAYRILVGKTEGERPLGRQDLGLDAKRVLNWL